MIDLSYRDEQLGVGAQIVRDVMSSHGVEIVKPKHAEVVLATAVHPLCADRLESKTWTCPTIVGGPGALSPATLGWVCDGVVLGDCQKFCDVLTSRGMQAAIALSNVWIEGGTRPVTIDHAFPWHMTGYCGEDNRRQVWVSRGCKKRCAFCQTGWAGRYAENPDPASCIRQAGDGQGITLVSNALTDVSFADQLPAVASASHTWDGLTRAMPTSGTVRIGVEGVSERLRKACGKHISTAELCDRTVEMMQRGVAVRWFMIAGLPGEQSTDWDDLRECVEAVGMSADSGVLQISFTAWVPEPATPLRDEPWDDNYYDRYKAFVDWYFGAIRRNRIAVFKCQCPDNRRKKAEAQMGCPEGNQTPNRRVHYGEEARLRGRKRYFMHLANVELSGR